MAEIGTPLDTLTEQTYGVKGREPDTTFEFLGSYPTEPISPFERYLLALEDLQPPVALTLPPEPVVTESPAAVNLRRPMRPTIFGPVTPSGYAEPPVDPMSYYTAQESVPETSTYTGGPTRWTDLVRSTQEIQTPSVTVNPEPSNIGTFSQTEDQSVTQQTESPNQDVSIPDTDTSVLPEDVKNQYIKTGTMPIVTNPNQGTTIVPPEEPYSTSEGSTVYPGGVGGIAPEPPRTTITLPSEAVTTTPVTPSPVYEDKVTITAPTYTKFDFSEPAPSRTPITLPGTSVISRPMPAVTTLPELTTIPTDTRRAPEALLRSFRDINYDPEEILAAAMRSMGGRMARRSILNELS